MLHLSVPCWLFLLCVLLHLCVLFLLCALVVPPLAVLLAASKPTSAALTPHSVEVCDFTLTDSDSDKDSMLHARVLHTVQGLVSGACYRKRLWMLLLYCVVLYRLQARHAWVVAGFFS